MDEIKLPLPENYSSIQELSNWLKKNMPHEHHIDGGPRWRIVSATPVEWWHISFTRPSDASLFLLKWE